MAGLATFWLPFAVCGGDIETARAALRDGLWDVARSHAAAVGEGSVEAQLVILESHARENRWDKVLDCLNRWGSPDGPEFRYYTAVAYLKNGDAPQAKKILENTDFSGTAFVAAVRRLQAEMAQENGENERAIEMLTGVDEPESKLLLANLLSAKGERLNAENLWREILSVTNLDDVVAITAASKLPDIERLKTLASAARSEELRRFASLRFGVAQIDNEETFEAGAKLVRTCVRDSPDSPGTKTAFLSLAGKYLDRNDFESAVAVYTAAREIWPDVVRNASVQEGLGWAYSELGRTDEALAAFTTLSELVAEDKLRALAIVKIGDVLASAGRDTESMERYREVMEKYPNTPAAARIAETVRIREQETEGRRLFSVYRFAEARRIFAEVAASDRVRRARMEYCTALCLYGEGRDEDAERIARKLANSSDDESVGAEAKLWLAKFAYNRNRWKEAVSGFIDYADMRNGSLAASGALVWAARAAFADNDFNTAVRIIGRLVKDYPDSHDTVKGLLVQGESLIELARFDESVLVLERVTLIENADPEDRLRAGLLRADALFAMGADNPSRYLEALEAYRNLRLGDKADPSFALIVAYKIGKTMEKLRRIDDAIDQYYSRVVLAYRDGRQAGVRYDEESRAAFSRAAFRLAEECESRGRDRQALHVLELVSTSDVPAADEADRRILRIQKKGKLL